MSHNESWWVIWLTWGMLSPLVSMLPCSKVLRRTPKFSFPQNCICRPVCCAAVKNGVKFLEDSSQKYLDMTKHDLDQHYYSHCQYILWVEETPFLHTYRSDDNGVYVCVWMWLVVLTYMGFTGSTLFVNIILTGLCKRCLQGSIKMHSTGLQYLSSEDFRFPHNYMFCTIT